MVSSSSTTFPVSDVPLEKVKIYQNRENIVTSLKKSRSYEGHKCTEIIKNSKFPESSVFSDNGFVQTVVQCYNHHHNLVIRPDDVWAAIMTQFSFYINKNAEEFRGQFVDFEGKKELNVKIAGTLREAPYDLLVKMMSKEIDRNMKDPEVKKWILPSFSTTTETDSVTVGVVFMAVMKKYFDYKFSLLCGIPNVTLEGTVDDWKNIQERLEKLKEYKLEKWYQMLEPIIKQFVSAKEGKADKEFWQRIAHHEAGGSGPSYLSGWITAFCVFDKDGNWQKSHNTTWMGVQLAEDKKQWLQIEEGDVPSGIVEVDIKIDDNGLEHKAVMFAGHLGTETQDDCCTLQPVMGWALALKGSDEEEKEKAPVDKEVHKRRRVEEDEDEDSCGL